MRSHSRVLSIPAVQAVAQHGMWLGVAWVYVGVVVGALWGKVQLFQRAGISAWVLGDGKVHLGGEGRGSLLLLLLLLPL